MSKSVKIAHLTSVHTRYDMRIFLKECRSLASAGYDVSLVVADDLSDETKDGVKIYGVRKEKNRIRRMMKSPKIVYEKAVSLGADIYHLHDPELLPIGLKLKKTGKKVIFDSHEDYPKQILSKPYINKWLLKFISKTYAIYEKQVLLNYDYIIAATSFIKQKISQWHSCVVEINNYPLLKEFNNMERQAGPKDNTYSVCYIGGLTEIRGIKEMIKAMEYCSHNVRLKLAGNFYPVSLRDKVMQYDGWKKIEELGFLNRKSIAEILGQSLAGLVAFSPVPNHINSQPNKLFEYMAIGLPVIASNFPLWRKIIEENRCGICVDPGNPEEIALAIDFIINNREQALEMGKNGKKAVQEKYNWEIEKEKLVILYKDLFLREDAHSHS